MNPEPSEHMDNSLMQLERELFSLTPAEPERRLAVRLERTVCAPVQVQRRVPPASAALPFQWKRVVVPAAAAVAAVAVLSGTENSPSAANVRTGGLAEGPDFDRAMPSYSSEIQPVATRGVFNREAAVSRSVPLTPVSRGAWPSQGFNQQEVEHHMWFNPETNSYIQLSVPRHALTAQPVVRFH